MMADDTDKESKTEDATEKKISDALEKGNTPFSREAPLFASMVGILIVLSLIIGPRASALTEDMSRLIDSPGGFPLTEGSDATLLLWNVALSVGRFLLPAVAVLGVAGIVASVFQNPPSLVLERIRPQWSRISPAAGWKRLFGAQGFVEFLKSIFKFGAIAVVCLILLSASRSSMINAMFGDPTQIPGAILSLAVRLVSGVCVATIVLVAVDLVWSRLRWHRDLRMSRQELKDEMKDSEGDPARQGAHPVAAKGPCPPPDDRRSAARHRRHRQPDPLCRGAPLRSEGRRCAARRGQGRRPDRAPHPRDR